MYRSTRIDLAVFNYPGFNKPIAIYAHGTFWHSGSRVFDDEQIAWRLRDAGWHVVSLWENDILDAALNDRLDRFIDDAIRSPLVW
jgi:G:T-mismatch repair DNA endonuclease (very short patch repair protein)